MDGKFRLDTNIAIAFRSADETLQRPGNASELYISTLARRADIGTESGAVQPSGDVLRNAYGW